MAPARRASLLAFGIGTFVAASACRGVLGIDDRPLLADEDAAGATSDAADSAPDVRDGRAPSPPSYCARLTPAAEFCDDFDDDPTVKARWDNANRVPDEGELGGGKIVADTATFTSAPRGAAFWLPPLPFDTSSASAYLQKTFRTTTDVTVRFALRIVTEDFPAGRTVTVPLASLAWGVDAVECLIVLARTTKGTVLGIVDNAHPTPNPVYLTQDIPVGAPKTVSIVVRREPGLDGGRQATAIVRVEGNDAAKLTFDERALASKTQRLTLGPTSATGPLGELRMTVDDVTVWFRGDR